MVSNSFQRVSSVDGCGKTLLKFEDWKMTKQCTSNRVCCATNQYQGKRFRPALFPFIPSVRIQVNSMTVHVSQYLIVSSTFVLTLGCVLSSVVVGRLRGGYVGPPTAFLRRGTGVPWVSCLDPPVCPKVQDDPDAKSQPFLVLFKGVRGVVTSCVLCARVSRVLRVVLTTGCISCATEKTYTARLEALSKLSVFTILSHSYHFHQIVFAPGLSYAFQPRHLVRDVLHLVQ